MKYYLVPSTLGLLPALLIAGCGVVGPEKSACHRAMSHYIECVEDYAGVEVTGGFEQFLGIDKTCDAWVISTPGCDATAYMNCLANISCDELLTSYPGACSDELWDFSECVASRYDRTTAAESEESSVLP